MGCVVVSALASRFSVCWLEPGRPLIHSNVARWSRPITIEGNAIYNYANTFTIEGNTIYNYVNTFTIEGNTIYNYYI